MRRARAAAIIGFAAALLVLYVAWDRYLSPEARVRRMLESMVTAAEAADVEAFLSFFASDYSDFMHPDRGTFETLAREGFARVDRMNVTLDPREIEVGATDARATVDVVVVAIRGEDRYMLLGEPFQPDRLALHLRREGEAWRIHRVEIPPP